MSEPMVPRTTFKRFDPSIGASGDHRFVTDSDAALLESIVRAADHLALELQPYRLDSEVTKCACCGGEWITEQPDGYQNHQRLCAWALYDAARGKVKP